MVDLDEAGRRLAAHPSGPLTPVPALQRRVQRRRRRRRVARAVIVGAVAAIVAVGATALPIGHHRAEQVQVGGQVDAGPTRPLPAIDHPKGWQPIDIGLLRLWAPVNESTSYAPGRFTFDNIGMSCAQTACLPPRAPVPLTVEAAEPTKGLTLTHIQHTEVWEHRAARTTVYDVPSLGVRLVATDATAQRVAGTLGPSSLRAMLSTAYPVAVPSDWKTVRFDGVAASIPRSWPVRSAASMGGAANCGSYHLPAAYLGHLPGPCGSPTITGIPPTILWLGEAAGVARGDLTDTVRLETGQATIEVAYGRTASAYLISLEVKTSTGTVPATIGLGADPTTALEILSSLRPAG